MLVACSPRPPEPAVEYDGPFPGTYEGPFHFEIDGARALADEPLGVRLLGTRDGEVVTVRARATDADSVVWESLATFRAAADGGIDVNRDAPIAGTWSGPDVQGLLWSMRPVVYAGDEPLGMNLEGLASMPIELTAEAGGRILARSRVERIYPWAPGRLHREEIAADDLRGTFWYDAARPGTRGGVLLLRGSGGNPQVMRSAFLAARGLAVLDLSYFGEEPLPEELLRVPLEYFDRGLAWLASHPVVDGGRLAVLGGSKGAEAALLVASRHPEVDAVVAIAPSHVVWQGIRWSPGEAASSWTVAGQELPYVPLQPTLGMLASFLFGRPLLLRPVYARGLEDPEAVERAAIPAERIEGAVLLISGGDDRMWPSREMADAVIARREARGIEGSHRHLTFPEAGHGIGTPGFPRRQPARPRFISGGTPGADEAAAAESWRATLEMLADRLATPVP